MDTSLFRQANYIESAVGNLGILALIGVVLVALALLAFTFQWRTALISFLAIPLSLVAAGMVLHLTGATFNMMMLAGIIGALVIVVDDAIVDVDNIARRAYASTNKKAVTNQRCRLSWMLCLKRAAP